MKRFPLATASCLSLLLAGQAALGATQAYWRHEEGPAGSLIPDGPDTVLDSSGNGNNMETFSSGFSPYTSATYSTTVSPLPLRSGQPNTLSLDFGSGSDGVTPEGSEPNDDNYTVPGKPVNTFLFSSMTVELAFRMKAVGPNMYEALFGKDGKPLGASPIPPLKIMVRGDNFPDAVDNQLFVEWIDGDGDIQHLATRETVQVGKWYHVAFTLSSSAAELWVAGETGPYVSKDALTGQDFAAADGRVIIAEPLGYSIGRGMYNNGVTDWSNAFIDEVKLSDAVLTPAQFEFLTNDADFDNDNVVEGDDFLTWQRAFGGPGTATTGDANGNGQVNGDDYNIWATQFGGPPTASVASGFVPEPATLALAGVAVTVGALRRRPTSNA